jgi:hypothetical protein
VWATQIGKRSLMLFVAFDWKLCHLFAGGGYRPAAVMATGFALERWNTRSKKPDFLTVAGHRKGAGFEWRLLKEKHRLH